MEPAYAPMKPLTMGALIADLIAAELRTEAAELLARAVVASAENINAVSGRGSQLTSIDVDDKWIYAVALDCWDGVATFKVRRDAVDSLTLSRGSDA